MQRPPSQRIVSDPFAQLLLTSGSRSLLRRLAARAISLIDPPTPTSSPTASRLPDGQSFEGLYVIAAGL